MISYNLSLTDSLIRLRFYSDRLTKEVDLDCPWRRALELELRQEISLGELRPLSHLAESGQFLMGLSPRKKFELGFLLLATLGTKYLVEKAFLSESG